MLIEPCPKETNLSTSKSEMMFRSWHADLPCPCSRDARGCKQSFTTVPFITLDYCLAGFQWNIPETIKRVAILWRHVEKLRSERVENEFEEPSGSPAQLAKLLLAFRL